MKVLPFGDAALLAEVDGLAEVLALAAAVRAVKPTGVLDVVPAARTVLLTVVPGTNLATLRRTVLELPVDPAAAPEEAASCAVSEAAPATAASETAPAEPAALLMKLKGIGPEFAAVLWLEALFRSFGNRRQVAAYAGLAPVPWQSGGIDRDQGIAKAGNPRLRKTMIQLAWLWIRHQPGSAISHWFAQRVGTARGRVRRIAIVAVARKLLVALWRYVGVIPEGAVLKA